MMLIIRLPACSRWSQIALALYFQSISWLAFSVLGSIRNIDLRKKSRGKNGSVDVMKLHIFPPTPSSVFGCWIGLSPMFHRTQQDTSRICRRASGRPAVPGFQDPRFKKLRSLAFGCWNLGDSFDANGKIKKKHRTFTVNGGYQLGTSINSDSWDWLWIVNGINRWWWNIKGIMTSFLVFNRRIIKIINDLTLTQPGLNPTQWFLKQADGAFWSGFGSCWVSRQSVFSISKSDQNTIMFPSSYEP